MLIKIYGLCHLFYNCTQNKISFNIGILFESVLILRLLNKPSCFLINFDFLLLYTAHFDNIIFPLFIALKPID